MKKPLIFENRYDVNDLRNVYNPHKYQHTLGEYVQTEDVNDQKEAVALQAKNANATIAADAQK